MTDEQKQKYKNNRKQYIEKMTDEEKQKHRKKYKDLSEDQK